MAPFPDVRTLFHYVILILGKGSKEGRRVSFADFMRQMIATLCTRVPANMPGTSCASSQSLHLSE